MNGERPRVSLHDRLLRALGSLFYFRYRHGALWFWGRRAREEKFIHRLLLAYPALTDRPRSELSDVARQLLGRLVQWRVVIASTGAALLAAYLTPALVVALRYVDIRVPKWGIIVLVMLSAGVASDLVRRWFITRAMDRAVADAYPALFCPCGYCLLGLDESTTRCPECGTQRTSAR